MVVQVYISFVCGNSEVKWRQQRALSILDSKSIQYEIFDMSGEDSIVTKNYVYENATLYGGTMSNPKPKYPLPPQFFNDGFYCGDFQLFDEANELGELNKFLKLDIIEENKEID